MVVEHLGKGIRMERDISQPFSTCTDVELYQMYRQMVSEKDTGKVELLKEIASRFVRRTEVSSLVERIRHGVDIWYVDFEDRSIEHGTVENVEFRGAAADSFSVNFDNDDFDEFYGSSLGRNFYLDIAEAQYALASREKE